MPRPDYTKAKKILKAKIAETMPGAVIDEEALIWALDNALEGTGSTDGPTCVSPAGRCLLGPTDVDWAEMALWAILSPPEE